LTPAFYTFALREPQNRDSWHRDLFACRWNALKRALMGGMDHETAGHPVCSGEHVFKDKLRPWKGCPKALVELTDTCQTWFHTDVPVKNNVGSVGL